MKIVAWTKKIYGDSTVSKSEIWDYLHTGNNIPSGKRIISTEHGIGEIDVVAPNVDESEFAPLNVCPVGTIASGEACLKDVEEMKPFSPPRKKEPGKTGAYGENTYCPSGWILGEKTEKITIKAPPKYLKSQGIVAKPGDLGVDYQEIRTIKTGPILDVKKINVCFKKEDMPHEPKWVKLVTDSIIGWGGYSEFPWWNLDWDLMCALSERIYANGAHIHDKKGYAVYGDNVYLLFDDKKDAESAKSDLKYYDASNEFFEDTKNRIIDDFIESKIDEAYPPGQTKLDAGMDYAKLKDAFKKKYHDEMEEEITDEKVYERMEHEKEFFYEDIPEIFPSYLGMVGEDGLRKKDIFFVEKYEGYKKYSKTVVIADEM